MPRRHYGHFQRRGRQGANSKSHKRTKSLKKMVKEIIAEDAELKVKDTTIANFAVLSTGSPVNIPSGMGGGDSIHYLKEGVQPFERIGRKVVLKKIMYRFILEMATQTVVTLAHDNLRIIVVWDKATAGTVINAAQLLSGTTPTLNAFNNLDYKGRYVTLSDKKYNFAAPGSLGADTIPVTRLITFFKEVDIPLEFTESTGDLSENRINSVQIFAISENSKIFLRGVVRVRYNDM